MECDDVGMPLGGSGGGVWMEESCSVYGGQGGVNGEKGGLNQTPC